VHIDQNLNAQEWSEGSAFNIATLMPGQCQWWCSKTPDCLYMAWGCEVVHTQRHQLTQIVSAVIRNFQISLLPSSGFLQYTSEILLAPWYPHVVTPKMKRGSPAHAASAHGLMGFEIRTREKRLGLPSGFRLWACQAKKTPKKTTARSFNSFPPNVIDITYPLPE
jgi:hypothetical protein